MYKLVKPAEYAKETGISRQAVYAKIKRGTLKSKEVSDQIYIVLDDENKLKIEDSTAKAPETNSKFNNIQSVIDSKNETIETLRGRIKDLKESNQQLTSVFRGEIDLLKEAFVEMKKLYSTQIEYKNKTKDSFIEGSVIKKDEPKKEIVWIGAKQLLKTYGHDTSMKAKLKNYFELLYSSGDTRVAKIDGKIRLDERFSSEQIIKEALLD